MGAANNSSTVSMNTKSIQAIKSIFNMTTKCGGSGDDSVAKTLVKEQYAVVVSLIASVVKMGTGVLVFVSGMADIIELSERLGRSIYIKPKSLNNLIDYVTSYK